MMTTQTTSKGAHHMHHRKRRAHLLAVLSLIAVLVLSGPAAAKNANPGVSPPHAKAFGKSYEAWSVQWWQWVLGQEAPKPDGHPHPLFDTTGEDCDVGQQGKVWFLGGIFGLVGTPTDPAAVTRDCAVPTGKALFFPILNIAADNVGVPPDQQQSDLQGLVDTYCTPFLHSDVDLAVELDGRPLKHLESYEIEPTLFSYDLPEEDNLYQFFGVDWTGPPPEPPVPGAASCGYYLMLTPLSKGQHELHIVASTEGLGGFGLDVTYNLDIGKGTSAESGGGKHDNGHKHKNKDGVHHQGRHRR
jgi:hypothetical protein